jgi:hypothetical protein
LAYSAALTTNFTSAQQASTLRHDRSRAIVPPKSHRACRELAELAVRITDIGCNLRDHLKIAELGMCLECILVVFIAARRIGETCSDGLSGAIQ